MKLSLSIIIPCYNEKNTISELLNRVENEITENDEIILVDDASNDGTREILEKNKKKKIKLILLDVNRGKGNAIRVGVDHCKNDIVIIQDADLEYNPKDYKNLILPFYETDADVVYGSRFIGGHKYVRIHLFFHYIANRLLTFLCNLTTNLNMTDMETGYKAFKKGIIKSIKIEENTFSVEPEITIKLAKKKYKFFEVPISYSGRNYDEGKKIGLKDAFIAVFTILKYSIKANK